MTSNFISPNWPAPANICALASTRIAGNSFPPYDQLNLGLHVNDNPAHVLTNRLQFLQAQGCSIEPDWLNQTHSTTCVIVEETPERNADAAITRTTSHCLVVMTADCLPILLCDKQGKEIAAIHAGWRGLADGIIEQTIAKMQTPPQQLMAWFGPSICGQCYEVGEDVYEIFNQRYELNSNCFIKIQKKWLSNQPAIAAHILSTLHVTDIYASERCTFEEKKHFFSYRRDGQTGRMGSFIWMKEKLS